MPATVHILATVRKPELIDAALLVFRTLRIGFPTANVCVWGNGLNAWAELLVSNMAAQAQARFQNLDPTSHDAWIEALIEENLSPFWVCDTDVVFWEPVEAWFTESKAPTLFAGRFEPEFDEEWTHSRHMARLHTCVMWLNPGLLRTAMRQWMARIPPPFGQTGNFPFVRQQFVPLAGAAPLFYDTCAGLYHALGGTPFSEAQNAAFDHLHCSTYLDLIAPHLSTTNFEAGHRAVYEDYRRAKGIRKEQDKYYAKRRSKPLKQRIPACPTA